MATLCLPSERLDQLIEFVEHILHFPLAVVGFGGLAQGVHAVAVVARPLDGVLLVLRADSARRGPRSLGPREECQR
jgi:hypothetical protein